MKRSRPLAAGLIASLGMLALILDSQTAIVGASVGIDLCIRTVIPALFPFFVLSVFLTGSILGTEFPLLRPIGKLCGIPRGAETILLTGLVGGYPVGAQCVSQAYAAGQLSKADARRMLGFCSNAGPAFLFGMSGLLFESKIIPLVLWIIHILSALITGMLLPNRSSSRAVIPSSQHLSIGQALRKSLIITGTVCGWVVIFRIILSFLERWFLWVVPPELQVILTGFLELTNGYLDLSSIGVERFRFILASVFLAFGGGCVALQTASVTSQAGLDMGSYFPGKAIQTVTSALLSILATGFLFENGNSSFHPAIVILLILGIILFLVKKRKNSSSIPAHSVV